MSLRYQQKVGKSGVKKRTEAKRFLALILLVLVPISSVLYAQADSCSFTVSGKVLDIATNQPIPYVSVKVRNTPRTTITNLQGEFFIDSLCTDANTLVISCLGYCDSICEHHYRQGMKPNIYLTEKVFELETTLIQAQRNKAEGTESISQINLKKAEIRSDPTRSLAASIAEEQGVTFTSTGTNVQLPVIHGLYGNRILVLNNGLKHGFQNWGTDHAPEIDITSVNNITILKGAAGVRFGPEALGGAIITEPNPMYLRNPFYAEIGTGFQSNGRGFNTNVELGQGSEKWSYFVNGNFTKIGDRHTPDYFLTNTGKEEKSVGLGSRYRSGNWDFKIYYSYVNQDLAILRSSYAHSGNGLVTAINSEEPTVINPFSYTISEPNQLTQHHLGKIEIGWLYSEKGKLTFRTGGQLNKRQEFDVRRNAEKPIIDLDLLTSDYQLEWKHPELLKFNGLLGIQYFNQNNDNNPGTGTTPFIPNYNTNRFSAFLVESKRFGDNTVEAGIRFDRESNSVRGRETNQDIFRDNYQFTNFTSSIGYVRELSESSSFRTNIGTAWRTPNMAELYSFGQHGFKSSFGLLRYYTNEEGELRTNRVININESSVQPEQGYKFINEFQSNKGRNSHTLTLFSHYIRNFIFDRPYALIGTIRGPMPVFIFDQADAFFLGTDYSWKRDWSKKLAGTFAFSYLWSKNLEKNETLINQPPISTSYELDWDHGKLWKLESSRLVVRPSYRFQQFQAPRTIPPEQLIDGAVEITPDSEIFDFTDAPAGYFLLSAAWRFKWKNLSGSLSVNNLFNARYRDYLNDMRYFADEPGRNILFTLNYRIQAKNQE